MRQPILTNEDLEKIRRSSACTKIAFETKTLDITYPAEPAPRAWSAALDRSCASAPKKAVLGGYNIIILSDRMVGRTASRCPRCWPPRPCTTT